MTTEQKVSVLIGKYGKKALCKAFEINFRTLNKKIEEPEKFRNYEIIAINKLIEDSEFLELIENSDFLEGLEAKLLFLIGKYGKMDLANTLGMDIIALNKGIKDNKNFRKIEAYAINHLVENEGLKISILPSEDQSE